MFPMKVALQEQGHPWSMIFWSLGTAVGLWDFFTCCIVQKDL